MTSTALLASLRDRLEVEELLTRYCSAIDERRFDRLEGVFLPHARLDYTSAGGPAGDFVSVRRWLERALAPFAMTQHLVTNFAIETDGDDGRSTCSFYNPMGLPQPDGSLHTFLCGGFYRDRLRRTPAGWRIRERVLEQRYLHGSLPPGFVVPGGGPGPSADGA